jgi:hypothetical protein
LAAGQDRAALLVFCVAIALCPKLLAISGQVTNDALAFVGGALAYWGASTEERRRWFTLASIALGLTIALWSKPNAGLAVGAWLGVFALLRTRRCTGLWLALACGAALGIIPYYFIIRDYSILVPVTAEQFGNVRQLDGFASYLPAFLLNIGYLVLFSDWNLADLERIELSGDRIVLGDDRVCNIRRRYGRAPGQGDARRGRCGGGHSFCHSAAHPPLVLGHKARL